MLHVQWHMRCRSRTGSAKWFYSMLNRLIYLCKSFPICSSPIAVLTLCDVDTTIASCSIDDVQVPVDALSRLGFQRHMDRHEAQCVNAHSQRDLTDPQKVIKIYLVFSVSPKLDAVHRLAVAAKCHVWMSPPLYSGLLARSANVFTKVTCSS